MRIVEAAFGTDAFEQATRGYVMANRINYVVAKPDTKDFLEYLQLVQDQFMGEPAVDPKDQYRDRELVPRALDAYERKHGVKLVTGQVYFHDEFPIAAAPDAIDGDLIGLTVHVHRGSHKRTAYDCYREAVEKGFTPKRYRQAISMMAVTHLPYWIHIDYLEIPEELVRKMHEHETRYSAGRGQGLLDDLIQFSAKTRFKAAAEATG